MSKKRAAEGLDMSNRAKDPGIVISGYYGFDNCGDEAVLLSIIHCIRKLRPDARITVLSGNPEKTLNAHGVDAVNRWNIAKISFALLGSSLLISGGGSLIQDVTSARSPGYYLGVIRMALFFRKKVMIYGQGVGPLVMEKNRSLAAKVFDRCHVITLRDNSSAELIRELGVKRDIHVACDPVMALSREQVNEDIVLPRLLEAGIVGGADSERKPLLVASIRCWKDNRHIAPVADLLSAQAAKGRDVLLVPAHFPDDMEAIAMLQARMASQPYVIDKCLDACEFLALTAMADMVFSMRLHGLICAMAMGTPMIGLSYDPKIDAFMEQAGMEKFCLSFEGFDLDAAKRLFEEPLQSLDQRRLEMRKLAWDTADMAVALLT